MTPPSHINPKAPSHTLIEVFPAPTPEQAAAFLETAELGESLAIVPTVKFTGLPLTQETAIVVITAIVEQLMKSGSLDPAELMQLMVGGQ